MFHMRHDLFPPNFLSKNVMVDLEYCLKNVLFYFFNIPAWYYYVNLRSLIIFSLSFVYIYIYIYHIYIFLLVFLYHAHL